MLFCAAGNFWDYELTFLSVAMRNAVSKKLLETVTGGPAKLMMLVNKSATGVQCNSFLYICSTLTLLSKESFEQHMASQNTIICCFACVTWVSTDQLPKHMCSSAQLAADLGSCIEESIVHAVLQEGGSWWLRYIDTPLQPAKLMLMQCTLLFGGTPLYCQLSGMFS